jgi:hypothetical protein
LGTLLAALRLLIRDDLDDAGSTIWTDDELDRHISNALARLSHHLPRQQLSTLATTSGNREIDISTLTPRVRIVQVEYPKDTDPRTFPDFSVWIDVLRITSGPIPDGSNADFYWLSPHTVSVSESTLSDDDEELLIVGAEAFACRQQAIYQLNRVATGGPTVDRDWSTEHKDLLAQFNAGIRQRKGVRRRRMYAPAPPPPTQDTDLGPGAQ